jgi:hypothetical protein
MIETGERTLVIKRLLHVELPIELTNGNDGRGNKWFKSSVLRKKLEQQLKMLGYNRKPFDIPVVVRVTRMLAKGQRFWDSSSCGRGNWKELEDALVAIGWFHDDSMKWITQTLFDQVKDVKFAKTHISGVTIVRVYDAATYEPARDI